MSVWIGSHSAINPHFAGLELLGREPDLSKMNSLQSHLNSMDPSIPQTQSKFEDYSPENGTGQNSVALGQGPPIFASDESWAYGGFDMGDDHDHDHDHDHEHEHGDAKRRRIARVSQPH